MADHTDPAWHQALAWAVTGEHLPGLGHQSRPDLTALAAILRDHLGAGVQAGPPHPVPAELMRGIGAAQFVAALADLLHRITPQTTPAPVVADRSYTAEERRLVGEVPPHHGS